jgi:hypothetical protein
VENFYFSGGYQQVWIDDLYKPLVGENAMELKYG